MPQITIKELAQRLGLSISTVSRALSDSFEVSKETREKVRALADELNYKPDLYASSLRSRKSKTIAVIIPEVSNSFFAFAIDGIEEIAHTNGYHVLIYITHDDHAKEASMLQHLLNGRVDGILMSVASGTGSISHIEKLKQTRMPVVFFDRACDGFDTLKIVTDDYASGYKAASHLIERDCQDLAYLSLSGNLSIDQKRKEGFLSACKKLSIKSRVVNCSHVEKNNLNILSELCNSPHAPDGIFASVEKLAVSLYEVCNTLEIKIPECLKVISFSNLKVASLLRPPLTTITQPAFRIGREAALALFGALKNNTVFEKNEEVIIPSVLIERESTRAKN